MPSRARITYRALSILAAAATVVAAIYTVAGYYAPRGTRGVHVAQDVSNVGPSVPRGQTDGPPASEARPASSNPGVTIGPGAHIDQTSHKDNSPNVISGGSVNITIGK